jgi:perosamine synthetase
MNQLAAAVALAQLERNDYFINLRKLSGQKYLKTIEGSKLLTAQKCIPGTKNSYFTFSAKFNGDEHGILWSRFRSKYMELGGDGIYAAAKLLYQEPIFEELNIGIGRTPVAETLQKKLMNFTTNQSRKTEMNKQCEVLTKTLRYFGDL